MKLIIFGIGKFYYRRKHLIQTEDQIVAYIDNNNALWRSYIDGIEVVSPSQVELLNFDKILLMSTFAGKMKKQLLDMGVEIDRIWFWDKYLHEIYKEKEIECGDFYFKDDQRNFLIISNELDYSGAPMTAVYAADVLTQAGYNVCIISSKGTESFVSEMRERGMHIVIRPGITYLGKKEEEWIRKFDMVLVNTFPMISCASVISRYNPVLWWILESKEVYQSVIGEFGGSIRIDDLKRINMVAVSSVAKENFNTCFMNQMKKCMMFGIPDESTGISESQGKIVFACIGGICSNKGQDVLANAISLLEQGGLENVEIWFIGTIPTNSFFKRIQEKVRGYSNVKFLGKKTRAELNVLFSKIDVVICASRAETMSMAIVEGMMYGKTCIVSDVCGVTEYIENLENGLIFESENYVELADRIKWVVQNKKECDRIGERAREQYQKYFSMESFGERLLQEVQTTISDWGKV